MAKMAGDRAKRQRAPSVNKLQAADDQVAALSKQLHAVKLQQESLQLRNRLLERDLKAEASGYTIVSQIIDDNTRRLVESEIIGDGNFSLRAIGKRSDLSKQQMMSMTLADYEKLYGQHVHALADLLLECCPEDKFSPANQRLEALVSESTRLLFGFVSTRLMSEDIRKFLAVPPAANVDTLLQTIGLSPRQKCALLMMRRVFAYNLGVVIAERQQVSAALQAREAGLDGRQHDVSNADTIKLMDRMQQLLRQEHGQVVILNLLFWQGVMTPYQRASVMIQVYPCLHCDAFDIVEKLAQESGEPEFPSLLEEATSLPSAQVCPMDAAFITIPKFLEKEEAGCSDSPPVLLKDLARLLGLEDMLKQME